MEKFQNYFKNKQARQEALHYAFRAIGRNQSNLSPEQTKFLTKRVINTFLSGEINSIVNRHFNEEIIFSSLVNPSRKPLRK